MLMAAFDLIIVGSGPAGLSAAITGRRNGLSVLVLEKDIVGGGPAVLSTIDSYPGIEKIDGWSFTRTMEKQARDLGVEIVEDEEVISVLSREKAMKQVRCARGKVFDAKTVILSTGGTPKKLGVQGEDRLARKGVHTCAQCAGPAYKGGKVMICGNGASALVAAEHLLNLSASVTVLLADENLRGDAIRIKALQSSPLFRQVSKARVLRILGDDKVTGVEVEYLNDGQTEVFTVDGIFLYLGLDPCTLFVEAKKNSDGYLHVDSQMQTSVPGIFAAGGVIRSESQIVIAAGDGARAALAAASYIAIATSESFVSF
jgi:thioredoxin reductase (NADPH)